MIYIDLDALDKEPMPALPPGYVSPPPEVVRLGQILEAYRRIWKELHLQTAPTKEWFEGWMARIPNAGCDCLKWLKDYLASDEGAPDYANWRVFGWRLHNAVNKKLGKPFFTWEEFSRLYPEVRRGKQAKVAGLLAVTSLAPHRLDRQTLCLDSWIDMGLTIASVNSPAEIASMRADYPQVTDWIAVEANPLPRVADMLAVSAAKDTPILLINADIETYGNQQLLVDAVANRRNLIGIRQNYEVQPEESAIEPWGLDAFVVFPWQTFDLADFVIGKPMWDYRLAVELPDADWIGSPFFFHKAHPVAWSPLECSQSHEAYTQKFGSVDWPVWRRSKPFPPL